MDYNFLKIENEGGITILKISAPKSLNALNSTILKELAHFVDNLDISTRVLIITGDGEKSFVAGADISEMANLNEQQGYEFGKLGAQVFRAIEVLPIPVIAAVNGFALGGGCELAMACDIRIASVKAKFGQPEVGLGIIPGFSGTYRLAKLIGQGYAKEMIYTGKVPLWRWHKRCLLTLLLPLVLLNRALTRTMTSMPRLVWNSRISSSASALLLEIKKKAWRLSLKSDTPILQVNKLNH